jgi:HEPN domain-containing protein
MDDYKIWIKRAYNSFALAKVEKTTDICYDDLCYNAQQAVEKGLKALLIFYGEKIERSLMTHDLFVLLKNLERYVEVPDEMIDAAVLTEYAIGTRYPGDYEEVTELSYQDAIMATAYSLDWINNQLV